MTGNLPDDVRDNDPNAPWNIPDAHECCPHCDEGCAEPHHEPCHEKGCPEYQPEESEGPDWDRIRKAQIEDRMTREPDV